jgi:hypothetical protein
MSGVLALATVPEPEGRQRFGSITREMLEVRLDPQNPVEQLARR